MNISISRSLSLGWDRMKKALFHPFDLSKWFRIGFAAWLAGFTDCNGGSSGGGGQKKYDDISNVWDDFFTFPETAWNWLISHPVWFNLIIVGVVLLFVIAAIIIWISSRGKFMFLHNVAQNKSEISAPWHEYRKEGNSLFIWEFFFGFFAFAVFVLFLIYCFVTGKNLYYADLPGVAIFGSVAIMALMLIGYLIIFGYISLFLKDFVVPIMYKHRIGVLSAWKKFLQLFFAHILSFIGYGLFVFVLGIAIVIGVLLFGLFTCCIGLLILAIPYIGAVILLPVSYTLKAFSIEYLAQFGDYYNVFPADENDIRIEEK
ncbi:MAG: hypothetical protein JXR61_00465 [Prolixibacteraceae bacterium]|nr:hypothetical protein [Prolixibacteraceae bacterium]